MARKQTLKSLLGGNDSRVEVDLNLDEQVFQAPTVRAGNYSVAAPVYAKTNALSQLSDSLERYSGPILKGYANIKEQQSIAMADASELLTREQLQLLNDGDSSGLKDSINNDKRQIDEAQRKKLISFAENPNNYERAYRRVGSRVAGVFTEDYLTNMEKYAEDESFDFQAKADELAEKYGLNGLGEQEFYKQINNISESTKARFGELKNAHMVRTDKAEAISDQSQQIINGTFNTDVIAEGGFYDAMAGKTLAQQEDIVQGMVTKLAEDHPKKALELIESYETGVIALGNGVVRDEFADSLENAFANEEKRVDLIAKGVETKRNDSIAEFQAVYSNAIALGQDIPESTDIFINDGLTITVDTSNAKNAADVANAVKDAVNNIPENDKTISNGTKALIINKFAGEVEKQKLNVVQQRENAGVNVASSQFMDLLAVQDSEGNYIYGEGMETTLGRASQTQEWVEELNPIIDAIYADPELDISQKVQQSKMATLKFVAEKKESHDQFVKEKEDAIKSIEAEKRTGGDQERFYVADVFTQVAKEKGDLEAMKQRPEIVEKAREFNAETERLRDEILNRSMTDEEIASGMTNAEFTLKKDEEMRALNVDRRALYQQDYGVDEEIDGVTSEKQIPKEVLKDQESINRGSETANVVIKESSGAGLAPTNFSIKNLDPDKPVDYGLQYGGDAVKSNPQTFRAINSTNLVEDINTPKSMGSEFKIGLFDNLRLSWITRNLPQEIDTIHKANQVRAIKFQEEGANYMDTEKGQSIVAEFVSGETMTRVVRDGKAGITVDELESGDLEGVAFNATALNQSATPILPFGLLNKAFLDSDNLTPQEEQQVRDYADALYDTSELDDKGRKVIINKMVELQVNAYTIIGFEFAK